MIFKVGDLVRPIGKRISVNCPSEDIGVVIEVLTHESYVETGRTVRVYWQKNGRKALIQPGWLEKIENLDKQKS